MTPPDFVVVGHVVRDLTPGGWRLGGTVTFAAVQAQRLGASAGIVTHASLDVELNDKLPGVAVAGDTSPVTTSFQNAYEGSSRTQCVLEQASAISPAAFPTEWFSAPVVLLGPVCGEVSASTASTLTSTLVGVSAQGWLRNVGPDGRVRSRAWTGPPFWSGAQALFVSDEDVTPDDGQIDRWIADIEIVAVTSNRHGARIFHNGQGRSIRAFPATEVDPTGAGDVFATAFLIELSITSDVALAARFAGGAAACAIEGVGIDAIAGRDEIEARLKAHPEVRLE